MSSRETNLLNDQLHALAAFLPQFEQPDFEFGRWDILASDRPDVFSMPRFMFSDVAISFQKALYQNGWIQSDFDWPSWIKTSEAMELRDSPDALAQATPEQLGRLLIVIVRQERFCEGSLEAAFESGLLMGIVRRAAMLCSATT